MRFTIATAAALVAGVSAGYGNYSTTEIPCSEATTITWSYGSTTTTVHVTAPTTVTLPCDVSSAPVPYSAPAVSTPAYTAPAYSSVPVYTPPVYSGTGSAPIYPTGNATSAAPVGTGYPTSAHPSQYTGAASKAGVGLAAVAGLAAYIL